MPPPLMRDQRVLDRQHLQLLSIFHFVFAGFAVLGIALLFCHYMIVSTVFMNPQMWQQAQQHPSGPPFDPQPFFKAFIWLYLFFGLMLILGGVGNLMAGLFLGKHKNRIFCLVIAALDCLQIPFGTVLGVFTLVVLMRPSVVELYETTESSS